MHIRPSSMTRAVAKGLLFPSVQLRKQTLPFICSMSHWMMAWLPLRDIPIMRSSFLLTVLCTDRPPILRERPRGMADFRQAGCSSRSSCHIRTYVDIVSRWVIVFKPMWMISAETRCRAENKRINSSVDREISSPILIMRPRSIRRSVLCRQ